MLKPGLAKKVSVHINEDTSSRDDYLYKEILSFLLERGVAGATVLRAQAGFGSHHRTHTLDRAGAEGQHLPVRVEFIESLEMVDSLLPALCDLVTDGLIDVQDTTIVKVAAGREQV
jgi:PII-like signaling protein